MKVPVPERFGRRMSVGPFEDPRDFLKFLVFATLGAFTAMAVGLLWGLPLIALGLALNLVRTEEESLLSHLLRRTVFWTSSSRCAGTRGEPSATGWTDPWGRRWRFYAHTPFPIYGRTPEELWGRSLCFVRLLSEAPSGEILFLRDTSPWNVSPYLPRESPDEGLELRCYRSLVRDIGNGRYMSRLLLGVPLSGGEGTGFEEKLLSEGWKPLSGTALLVTLRRVFPTLRSG